MVAAYACNPSTCEVEAGLLWIQGQVGLQSEALCLGRRRKEGREGGRKGGKMDGKMMEGRTSLTLFQLIYTDLTNESAVFPISSKLACSQADLFRRTCFLYIGRIAL